MEHFGAFLLVLTCVLHLPLTEGFPTCSRERFSCNNSRCVPLNLRCDGVDDCGDSSDEVSCLNCTTGSFHCVATARCVPGHRICDGKADCSDGADEQLNACISLHKPQACSRSEFRCSNGHCVTSSWRCDHSNDCEDGSDEENCDQNECEVNNGGCSHMCIDLTLGFMCECPSGMRLVEDTHCEDVDQCLDLDLCDQTCDHSNGSPTCECQDGYVLTPGTGQCEATGDVAYMVVSTQEGLQLMDLGGSEQRNITSQTSSPGPVSALNANNTLYWASPENDIIYSLSLDSSGQSPTVLLKASTGIRGLSVDWTHELLYWVSTSSHALHVASLNGSKQRQLILGLSRPTAVAVQPLLGHLFWADSGASPRIERASLDGEGRIALITSAIRHPVAISLDIPRGLLYWADSGLRTISRVAFNGQHRKTVVESNGYLDQPFGLVVFESRVYWSDQLTNSACSADKHNGRTLQVSQRLGSVSPAGLAILHPLLQPAGRVESRISRDFKNKDLSKSETRGQLPISPFTLIFSLTVILCILLVGAVLWWQRAEFRGPHSFSLGGVSLKESQDPLLLAGLSAVHERKDGILTSPTQ
ncbi:low-density lipoprotein receptor-related protein 8-like isoform X2 [Xyrauchen texanus]|uniref:low-density lipoprotein receptor-related protein 8-like isoform X2 n=1 Tax=Xyrauchen texanus TaxID=154827 RepID=UPI0022419033|nr:low-density lipoprotein receptor-related protein 8-like isoform X2 [Xyrauchen texanus]